MLDKVHTMYMQVHTSMYLYVRNPMFSYHAIVYVGTGFWTGGNVWYILFCTIMLVDIHKQDPLYFDVGGVMILREMSYTDMFVGKRQYIHVCTSMYTSIWRYMTILLES
jgi:protein-S-isoprenylcysteine O-methyltransferase Ste14